MGKKVPQKTADAPSRLRHIIFFAFGVLAVGATFYHYVEKLKWLDSFYFSVITLTTVGYGDITPKTDAGKLFTIFYVLIGIGLLGASVNYILRRRMTTRIHKHDNDHDDSSFSGYSNS